MLPLQIILTQRNLTLQVRYTWLILCLMPLIFSGAFWPSKHDGEGEAVEERRWKSCCERQSKYLCSYVVRMCLWKNGLGANPLPFIDALKNALCTKQILNVPSEGHELGSCLGHSLAKSKVLKKPSAELSVCAFLALFAKKMDHMKVHSWETQKRVKGRPKLTCTAHRVQLK